MRPPSRYRTRRRHRAATRIQRGGNEEIVAAGGAKRKRQRARTRQPEPGPSQCHPSLGPTAPAHGCLPLEILRKVATKLGIQGANLQPAELRQKIQAALTKEPGGERTFLYSLPLGPAEKDALAKKYLRPAAPKEWVADPDMWLDSNNIAQVLNQYEDSHPEFEFMGPFPIDFAAPNPYRDGGQGQGGTKCLMNEICELRVQKAMENGTKSIGIVYNLDPHYKSGSHWVANYIDITGHACYYFDSYGMKPPPQVERFMKWLTTQDPKMKLVFNARRLQYKDTECGVYCIYFITRMLSGDKFTDITRRQPNDSDMLDLRDWLFST